VKYRNEQIRQALAAEYALGTLHGQARRRFERSLKDDPALRNLVAQWQARLAPLDAAIQPVRPPARVWRNIEERIRGRPRALLRRVWESAGVWRAVALTSVAAALVLAGWLPGPGRETMVVVMSDSASNPALVVSWRVAQQRGERRLRVRVIGHQSMALDTAWELWMLPGGDRPPVSLGLISTDETQTLPVPSELSDAINAAQGLAMSVEPKGGSPTGRPTGPVLYQGLCTPL
jgi:anti-sigma-K factor RskA